MTVAPASASAGVIDLRLARIRRLAAENPDLSVLLELADRLTRTSRFAELDALVAAVQTAWGAASYAERVAAVAVINGLLRAEVAA